MVVKRAVEALEQIMVSVGTSTEAHMIARTALADIRAALAQSEREPVAWAWENPVWLDVMRNNRTVSGEVERWCYSTEHPGQPSINGEPIPVVPLYASPTDTPPGSAEPSDSRLTHNREST